MLPALVASALRGRRRNHRRPRRADATGPSPRAIALPSRLSPAGFPRGDTRALKFRSPTELVRALRLSVAPCEEHVAAARTPRIFLIGTCTTFSGGGFRRSSIPFFGRRGRFAVARIRGRLNAARALAFARRS